MMLFLLILVWFSTRKEDDPKSQAIVLQGGGTGVGSAVPPPPSTASVKIGNNAPVVKSIQLLPTPIFAGQAVRAEVITEDQDGDFVQRLYEWQVNGKMVDANDIDTLDGSQVHSGDKILVYVTPSDPYSKGKMHVSPLVTVMNLPPEISSIPPSSGDDGQFVYQIEAKDPDFDTLRYRLLKGPSDMNVNSETGLVHWVVALLPTNPLQVAFEVSDQKGGTVIQQFNLQTPSTKK